jgi:hypothetical protein
LKKLKIFIADLILCILKYELIVTIPTIILDLLLGTTGLRKFAVLLFENYDVPFWLDLIVTLLVFNAIAATLLFLIIRFVEKFVEKRDSDIKALRTIGAMSSFTITALILMIKFFGALNGVSILLSLLLSIIFGFWFLPGKNNSINKLSG